MSVPVLMNSSYPIEGPDISIYQNYTSDQKPAVIDFARVRSCRPGIKFVMVKFSEGNWTGYPDSVAVDQATRADDRGLHVIPYHYWKYDVPPADQARRFKAVIDKLGFTPRRFMADPIIPPPETPPTYTEACEAGITKLADWLTRNKGHVLEKLT